MSTMLTRVIFKGEVFYRVVDLMELFDISPYKMKKAINDQKIPTTKLSGFGHVKFVKEEDVSAVEINGEITIIKTVKKPTKAELKKERKGLMKKGALIYLKFHKAQKEHIADEIIEKHLGEGEIFKEAPVEKLNEIRATVAELEIAVANLDESPVEVA
jgi:hypothetical protein